MNFSCVDIKNGGEQYRRTSTSMHGEDSTTTHRSELGQTSIVYVGTLLASLKNSKEVNALRTNFCVFALVSLHKQTNNSSD
jgi:hypothetical protein